MNMFTRRTRKPSSESDMPTDALYRAEWQYVALHLLASNEGWYEIAEAGAAHLREAGYAAIADGPYIVVDGTRYRDHRPAVSWPCGRGRCPLVRRGVLMERVHLKWKARAPRPLAWL